MTERILLLVTLCAALTACGDGIDAGADGAAPDGPVATSDAASADAALPDAGLAACAVRELACGEVFVAGDTAGASDDFDGYSCLSEPTGVGELIYQFRASTTQPVVVTLSNRSDIARLLVMEGSCSPGACALQNYYSVRFEALAGKDYFFAVEPAGGATSVSYEISVVCDAPSTESGLCTNGLDDDGDFRVDCADPDCYADPACGFGACTPVATIDCDTTLLAGDTAAAEATDASDSYACPSLPETRGREIAYTFVASATEPVLFTVSDRTAVTGIAVLSDEELSGCHATNCLAFQWYSVIANLEEGKTYHVVVDRMAQGEMTYNLSVICSPPATETACDDGIDDDGDILIDCDDPDCNC